MKTIYNIENRIISFWSKVKIGEPNECWEWQAGKYKGGYGSFKIAYKENRNAHVFAFLLANLYVPECVLHKCDNPACCNPSHLIGGTQTSNVQDMIRKGRFRTKSGTKGKKYQQKMKFLEQYPLYLDISY